MSILLFILCYYILESIFNHFGSAFSPVWQCIYFTVEYLLIIGLCLFESFRNKRKVIRKSLRIAAIPFIVPLLSLFVARIESNEMFFKIINHWTFDILSSLSIIVVLILMLIVNGRYNKR